MTVLVIEDEPTLAQHVVRALERAGHEVAVRRDGAGGLAAALAQRFDLLVLDVGLPRLDGFSLLRELRREGRNTRVLMLTARGEVGDRVTGLKAGADDYLAKPFAMEELLARVEALGRRVEAPQPGDVLQVGDLRLDVRERTAARGAGPVTLSPREFELLALLMREPGRVFTRTELCERVWHREHEYDTRTVEIFIARLRRKLDEGGAAPLIQTVRGVGYTLRAPGP